MIISMIVAHGKNRELGKNGKMPWHVPEDLRRFRKLTLGHCLLMGRKTFESIGKPLPGRKTIVLTSGDGIASAPHLSLFVVNSLMDGIELAKKMGESELFIAGGGEVYAQAYPLAEKLYLSEIDYSGDADTFFPFYSPEDWIEEQCEQCADTNVVFKVLRRVAVSTK
ncbi:MAG: dihydrofolate reductase [Oligoflexia bacterium]|nr:dihydrofolate reductase [Oligoflexia bacterium]